jgi:hypothetical protein
MDGLIQIRSGVLRFSREILRYRQTYASDKYDRRYDTFLQINPSFFMDISYKILFY